jgi:protein-arginine kinase activator protein McsA
MKLSKHLTTAKVYKERLAICKACEFYFSTTGTCLKCGCFMRIKAKISSLSCPIKKWVKTSILEDIGKIDKNILNEIAEIWPDIKDKKAKDHKVKARLIELHNTIYNTGFNKDTNCGSCLASVYNGIAAIHKKYIENE